MKKVFCLLLALILILSAGCAQKDVILAGDEAVVEDPIDAPVTDEKETIDVPEDPKEEQKTEDEDAKEPAEKEPEKETPESPAAEPEETTDEPEPMTVPQLLASLSEDLEEYLKDRQYIVVQAKKVGESTIVADEQIPFPYEGTTRMQLEITKVYHGELQPGDRIHYWELIGTYRTSEDTETGFVFEGLEAISDDTEYLMLLEAGPLDLGQFYRVLLPLNPVTGYLTGYSYVSIDEREAITKRIQDGTADKYDQFRHGLFEGLTE